MKDINFNNFKSLGMNLRIEDKTYSIDFIPYPIEKDIYNSMEKMNKALQDIYNLSDEWLEKMKGWIWGIFSHKKNHNEIEKEVFDDLGLAEIIAITIELTNFIARRVRGMTEIFSSEMKEQQESAEKKTAEKLPTSI